MGLKKLRKQTDSQERDSQNEEREDIEQDRQKKQQQVQEKTKEKEKVKQKRKRTVKKQGVQLRQTQIQKQDHTEQTQTKVQQMQEQTKQQVKPKRRKTLRKQNKQFQQGQNQNQSKPKKQQIFNQLFSKYRQDEEQSKRYYSEQKDGQFDIQQYGKKSKINVDIEQLEILEKKKEKKIKKPKEIKVKNKYFSDFSSLDQEQCVRDQQRDIGELQQEPKFTLEYQKKQPKKVSNFEMISKRISDIKDKRQFKVENDPKMKDKIRKTLNNVHQDTEEVEINVSIPNVFAKKTASGALYLKNTTSQQQSQQYLSRTSQMLQSQNNTKHNNTHTHTNTNTQANQNPQNKKKKGINRSEFYSTLTNQIKIKNQTKISSQQVKQCFKSSELKDDEFDFELIEDIKSHSMSRSSNGSRSSHGSRESPGSKKGQTMAISMDKKNEFNSENSNRFGQLSNTLSKKNNSINRPPTFNNSLNSKPTSTSNLLLKRTNSQNSMNSPQSNQNSNSNSLGFRSNANARKTPLFISEISQVHESQNSSIQNGDSLNYKSTNIMRQKQNDKNIFKPVIKSEMQIKHSSDQSNNLTRQNHNNQQLKLNPDEVKRQYESTYNLFEQGQRVQIIKSKINNQSNKNSNILSVTESVIIIKNPKNKGKKFVPVQERKTVVGKKFKKDNKQKGVQKADQSIKYTQLVKHQSQVDPSKIDICRLGPKTNKNSKSNSQKTDYNNQKNEKSQSIHTDLNSNLINDPGPMQYSNNSMINSNQYQNNELDQDKYNSNLISFKNQQNQLNIEQSDTFQQQIIQDFNSNSKKIQVQSEQKRIRKKEKGKKNKNKKNKNKKSSLDSYFQDQAEYSSDQQGHTSGQQTDQEQDADQDGQLNGLIDRQGGYQLNKNLVMRKYQQQVQKDEEKMIQKILKNLYDGKKKHEETQSQKRMRLRMKQAQDRFKQEDKEQWEKMNKKETGPMQVPQKLEIENQNQQQMHKRKLQQLQQQIKRPKLEQQPQISTQLNIFQNFKPNIPKRSTLIHRPLINKQTMPPVSIRHQPKKILVDNKRNSVINQKRKSLDNTVIDLQANKNKVQKTKSIELGIIDSQNIEIEIDENQENNNSRASRYNENNNSRNNNKDVEI